MTGPAERGDHFVQMIGSRSAICRSLIARVVDLPPPRIVPIPVGRPELDLSDADAVAAFELATSADAAVVFAAMTRLADCRADPEAATQINTRAPAELARKAADAGVPLLLLSTNQVFDGGHASPATDAPTCPQTIYGRTKADAERAVLDAGGSVLRLTKVVPPGDARLRGWHDALGRGEAVTAFDDLFIAPVTMARVVDTLLAWLEAPAPGVLHCSGAVDVSWYEVARRFAAFHRLDPHLVRPGSASGASIPPEERPRHTALACADPQPLEEVFASLRLPPTHTRR